MSEYRIYGDDENNYVTLEWNLSNYLDVPKDIDYDPNIYIEQDGDLIQLSLMQMRELRTVLNLMEPLQ